ncbi:MAG: gliding motility-associated C-terminal domain-containing protein [Bacteroidota bacterium]
MKLLSPLLLLVILTSTCAINTIQAQFFLNGTAITLNDSCYQLTATNNWEVGSIWNGDLISLEESFDVIVDVFLGCQDETGADGIVFALQPISTSIGVGGGDIGIGGVTPSLGVEIDTYLNENFADPIADHITIVRDGNLNHNTPEVTLAGPIQASAVADNIEDCSYHAFRVTWDANEETLSVYFDCELRLSYTGDIVEAIFGGDPLVYWGFTAATGGLNNVQEVCFSYTSFIDELVDQTICPGEETLLEASGGSSYSWSPTEGLSATDIANPIAAPTETTLYTVEILDDCGVPFYDDVLITVNNEQFDLNLTTDPTDLETVFPGQTINLTAIVEADSLNDYTYNWSTTGNSSLTPSDMPTIAVTASSVIGSESLALTVNSPAGCLQDTMITLEITTPLFELPNVFSPNGDNVNDRFGLFTLAQLDSYNCKVFNRWGQVVFETTSSSQVFWDGTFGNSVAPADVYIYQANFEIGGIQYEREGSITLVR